MVPVCIQPAVPKSANAWLVLPEYSLLSMSGYWCEAGSWCTCELVVARCAGALVVWMMHTTSRCTAAASVLVTNDTAWSVCPAGTSSHLASATVMGAATQTLMGQARCTVHTQGFSGRTLKTMDSALGLLSKLAQRGGFAPGRTSPNWASATPWPD